MKQSSRVSLAVGALVLATLASAPALACGGGGVASKVGVTTNSQRIFMSVRAAGTTDIVAQITVPETTADYGVLIPVPDEPALDSKAVSAPFEKWNFSFSNNSIFFIFQGKMNVGHNVTKFIACIKTISRNFLSKKTFTFEKMRHRIR